MRLFGIDLRSLVAFRIGLGALFLWDLYGRSKTLRIHYTGEGLYPGEIAAEMRPDSALFHLFLLSDRLEVQALLFGASALLAILLVLGWHTRLVSVLLFFLVGSLIRRNHWACHTGDAWLKVLLFWAMFLPLGDHFSIDRLRSRWKPTGEKSVLGIATAGVLLQVAVFYFSAGYLKARYEVWQSGEAVWVFTNVIEYARPFGAWLGEFPTLCRFLTFATLALESLAPFLLFTPIATVRLRVLLVLGLSGFHLTLQSAIHIGIFQMICVAALMLFLPGGFWEACGRAMPKGWLGGWRRLRDGWIARFGRAEKRARPAQGALARAGSRVVSGGLWLALTLIAVSNVNTATRDPYDPTDGGVLPLPKGLDDFGREASLVQNWNMFTDIDRLFFGWFLVVGQQEDGEFVNVLEHRPFDGIALPEHYARFFPNHNSRRYWREMAQAEREFLQKPMCDYLAREWKAEGRVALTHLAIFHVGRIPNQKRARDTVKPVCTQWEAPHEPLKAASEETRAFWGARRETWKGFLDGLPKTVPKVQ